MKEIKAYIQPFMLQKVINALRNSNIQGMSITEIKGAGKDKDESHPPLHYELYCWPYTES